MKMSRIWIIILFIIYAFLLIGGMVHNPYFTDELSFQKNICFFTAHKTLMPIYTNYPTLYSYLLLIPSSLLYIVLLLFYKAPLVGWSDPTFLTVFFRFHFMPFIFLGRMISILSASAIVYLLLKDGQRQNTPFPVLIISGLLMILSPLNSYFHYANFALPDVVVALIALLAILALFKFYDTDKPSYLYWATALIACAASLKLNGALFLVAPFLAILKKDATSKISLALKMSFLFVAISILCTPFFIIKPAIFKTGMIFERNVVWGNSFVPNHFIILGWPLIDFFKEAPFITALFCLSLLWSFFQKPKDKLVAATTISVYLALAILKKQSIIYFIPLIPLCYRQMMNFLSWIWGRLKHRKLKILLSCCIFLIITQYALDNIDRVSVQLRKHDNRDIAAEWIRRSLPFGSRIILDWSYCPLVTVPKVGAFSPDGKSLKNAGYYYNTLQLSYKKYFLHDTLKFMRFSIFSLPANDVYPQSRLSQPTHLVLSSSAYNRYLDEDRPDDPVFQDHKNFYNRVLKGRSDFRYVTEISEGLGPKIIIFRNF